MKRNKMEETLLCPYTRICEVYQTWSKVTARNNLVVIGESSEGYQCSALNQVKKSSEGSEGRFGDLETSMLPDTPFDCSHLKLLNLARGQN